jgi:hypothetical protein
MKYTPGQSSHPVAEPEPGTHSLTAVCGQVVTA